MINYYKSVTSSSNVLGSIGIQDLLNKIKLGDENLNSIKQARELYYVDELKYSNIKRNGLPCYTLNFTFNKNRRNCNIINSTGYIYIDIDDTTAIDFNNPLLFASWVSLSGNGRAALVKVDNLNTNNYSYNYKLISEELGVYSDKGAMKKSQLNVLSFDPSIFINSNSNKWSAKTDTTESIKNPQYSNNNNNKHIIATVMGENPKYNIRYDNLDELIDNVEFNGDVIHDYREKVNYSKVHIPFNGINNGSRNSKLSGIAYQMRALCPHIESSLLLRIISKINNNKCSDPLSQYEIKAMIQSIMKIELSQLVPIENGTRRFLFNPDYDLTRKEKLQNMIKIINSDKVKNSKLKIQRAIDDWDFIEDGRITQKSLKQKTGMNIKTIEKYYPLFKSDIQLLNKTYYKKE